MPVPAEKSKVIRFGVFEVNPQEAELRKHGLRIKLQDQPFQILLMLLEHPGQTVSRDDLRQKLWPADTFVDFDHSLNSSIKKLREALGDNSENPRFIETLHRRGYRFIGPVGLPYTPVVEGSEHGQSVASAPANVAPDVHPAGQPLKTSMPAVFAVARRHKLAIGVGGCAVLIVVSAAAFGVYSLLHRLVPVPFQKFTITQITNTGKATRAAVSPDGSYVLSVMNDSGLESVWLRNVPTGSDTQVIPPSDSHYASLTFSPDGNYFYFCRSQFTAEHLYRSPVLGGATQMIVRNGAGDITFSPDRRRIAYYRGGNPDATHWRMFTASLDGYDETLLRTGDGSDWPVSWAWSPKGGEIFTSVGDAINWLDARTGESHRLVRFKDQFVTTIRWLPDARALIANYREESAKASSGQIGLLRATGGDIKPITRDANTYHTLALSEDGRTLATVQRRSYGTIYVLSKIDRQFVEPRSILSRVSQFDEGSGLSWTADGNLLLSDNVHVWKLRADGKNQTQLLAHSRADIYYASPCGASYLVLTWGPTSIWRTNADGSNPLRLTNGESWHRLPVCSPDHKWVYYVDWSQNISRTLLDGSGKPEVILRLPQNYDFDITEDMSLAMGGLSVSSESTMLAAVVFDVSQRRFKVAVFEPGASSPPRMLDADSFSGQGLQFTPDGKAVAYIIREKGVDNLWVQPLDGSAGYRITDFNSEQIWSFSMSPDTKSLAVLRGHYDSDVVLLQETKP